MIGAVVGGCKILDKLGEGGFGAVYKAVQLSLDRTVAIKLLRPECVAKVDATVLFSAEARSAAKIDHPNILRVYDHGWDGDTPYIVMEFVDGKTLDKAIAEEGAMPVDRALAVAKQVAEVLDHAHRQDIVHSDLNPRNVMLSGGRAVVGDFLGSRQEGANCRNIVGVPEYISPEQARGLAATPRSDMYSLGIILYEMLIGSPPFSERNPTDTLFRQISSEPTPPAGLNAAIPPRLDRLIMRLLAKNPDARFEGCAQVVEEIVAVERELQKEVPGIRKRERPPVSRALAAALIVVLAGLVGIGYLVERSVAEERSLDALVAGSSASDVLGAVPALKRSVESRYGLELRRGKSLLDRRRFRPAATAFHRASKLKPNEVDPHLFLAAVFIERESFRNAKSELAVVLKMEPDNKQAEAAMNYIRSQVQPRQR